jgi:hypothetical protein
LQNSADINYVHSQHFPRITEQTHVLRSPEDLQNPQKKKSGVFPAAAALPELLYQNEHNTSNTMYSSMFYHMFRTFVSAIMADHKRPNHGRHKRPKYVAEHRRLDGVLNAVFVLIVEQMLTGKHSWMVIPKLTCPLFLALNLNAVILTLGLYSSTAW